MASATVITSQPISLNQPHLAADGSEEEAAKWASIIKDNLTRLESPENIDRVILLAPSDANNTSLIQKTAARIYPAGAGNDAPEVRYQKDLAKLREAVRRAGHTSAGASTAAKEEVSQEPQPRWSDRILAQGPWDQTVAPDMLKGAPSLPMPVEISDADSLSPFFDHLQLGGNHETATDPTSQGQRASEPYYDLPTLEFDKGVLYEDGRMDLCKMALGPPNITRLMQSLRSNTFVRHFLLGNNIIGPVGARSIAQFVRDYPDRIDTWYLAGNCIDGDSFSPLADALVNSPAVTNLWLKRNPLGPQSVDALFRLITQTPNLRTLDLDQTELGDAAIAELFTRLAENVSTAPSPLRILYMSATGVSTAACEAIARYLASPKCQLSSLYLSNNPIGDLGAKALTHGLQKNKTLHRLSLQSIGLTDEGAAPLITSLHAHPALETLDLGQSYATQDLNAR